MIRLMAAYARLARVLATLVIISLAANLAAKTTAVAAASATVGMLSSDGAMQPCEDTGSYDCCELKRCPFAVICSIKQFQNVSANVVTPRRVWRTAESLSVRDVERCGITHAPADHPPRS
jgi:hypothetical protein